MPQKIFLGTDHAGFKLKGEIEKYLLGQGFNVKDMGAHSLDSDDDYVDFVVLVAKKVAEDPDKNKGIILGGSGQGEAIAANKIKGIRAAVYYGGKAEIIKLSRLHNNANILSLGARFLSKEEALDAVKIWMETGFSNEDRHIRRIKKINNIKQ